MAKTNEEQAWAEAVEPTKQQRALFEAIQNFAAGVLLATGERGVTEIVLTAELGLLVGVESADAPIAVSTPAGPVKVSRRRAVGE